MGSDDDNIYVYNPENEIPTSPSSAFSVVLTEKSELCFIYRYLSHDFRQNINKWVLNLCFRRIHVAVKASRKCVVTHKKIHFSLNKTTGSWFINNFPFFLSLGKVQGCWHSHKTSLRLPLVITENYVMSFFT